MNLAVQQQVQSSPNLDRYGPKTETREAVSLDDDPLKLAMDLYETGQIDRAWEICRLLLQQYQDHPPIYFLMGLINVRHGDREAALDNLNLAVKLDSSVPEYVQSLASLYFDQGEFKQSCQYFERAVKLDPDNVDARLKFGRALGELGRWRDASDQFEAAAASDPDNEWLNYFLIMSFANSGRINAAYEAFLRTLNSDLMGAYLIAQAAALLPIIPRSLEEMNNARDFYDDAISRLATKKYVIDETKLTAAPVQFMAAYQCRNNAPTQNIIGSYFVRNCPSLKFTSPHVKAGKSVGGKERLKIGFISAHFFNHSIGKLNHGIIANMDRRRFEVVVVFTRPPEDNIGRYIKNHCDDYIVVPNNLAEARHLISAAALDIIFYPDIGMEPLTYFLAFSRLAAVQCVGWGHPMTTGVDALDYFLSAEDLESDDYQVAESHYNESLVKLRRPLTYHHANEFTAAIEAPDFDFDFDGAMYVCLQNLFKIHPDFDELLIGILRADPTGHAVFIEGKPGWSDILRTRWQLAGPDIIRRIHFVPRMPQPVFFGLVRAADVVLDTIHFSGGTSSIETFGLSRAIVTLPSTTLHSGCVTAAYYHQMGITEYLARDKAEYVDIAVRLGTDRDYRDKLEGLIQENCHKLFKRQDTVKAFADFLIDAYDRA